jgi:hypothetical protein
MKVLIAVALIAALTITALAQRAQNNTDEQLKARNAPDAFIYSASAFGPDKNGDSNFTIDVGNTGTRTIIAVEWEYYSPGNLAQGVNRTFRSAKLKLGPDQRNKLTQQVHHYTDKFVTGFRLDTVRIVRVEYADGSSWTRPVDQK